MFAKLSTKCEHGGHGQYGHWHADTRLSSLPSLIIRRVNGDCAPTSNIVMWNLLHFRQFIQTGLLPRCCPCLHCFSYFWKQFWPAPFWTDILEQNRHWFVSAVYHLPCCHIVHCPTAHTLQKLEPGSASAPPRTPCLHSVSLNSSSVSCDRVIVLQ